MHWVVRISLPTSRFLLAFKMSLGPQEISWLSGMYNPIHLSSRQCMDTTTSVQRRNIYPRIRQSITWEDSTASGDGHLSAFVFPEKRPKVAKAAKSRLMASLLHKTGRWTFHTQHECRTFLTNERLAGRTHISWCMSAVNYLPSIFCLRQNKINHIVLPPTDFRNHSEQEKLRQVFNALPRSAQ